jgi:hypothetical protein
LFAARTGINAIHVPFRGAAQTIPAMLAGDVTFAVDNLASYISQIEAGTMRALAVTSAQRWPTLPNVPTMAEAGVPDFVVTSWAAYVMPIATPPAIVDKLATTQKEMMRALGACPSSRPSLVIARDAPPVTAQDARPELSPLSRMADVRFSPETCLSSGHWWTSRKCHFRKWEELSPSLHTSTCCIVLSNCSKRDVPRFPFARWGSFGTSHVVHARAASAAGG